MDEVVAVANVCLDNFPTSVKEQETSASLSLYRTIHDCLRKVLGKTVPWYQ